MRFVPVTRPHHLGRRSRVHLDGGDPLGRALEDLTSAAPSHAGIGTSSSHAEQSQGRLRPSGAKEGEEAVLMYGDRARRRQREGIARPCGCSAERAGFEPERTRHDRRVIKRYRRSSNASRSHSTPWRTRRIQLARTIRGRLPSRARASTLGSWNDLPPSGRSRSTSTEFTRSPSRSKHSSAPG